MLYTENLILRKAQESDLYDIFNNIWSDKNIYENMFFKPTTNIEELNIKIIIMLILYAITMKLLDLPA